MTIENPETRSTVIAVFDFDGTLTRRDTSLPFVFFVLGPVRGWLTVVRLAPLFLLDLLTAAWVERPKDAVRAGANTLGSVWGRWETNVHERLSRSCFAGKSSEWLKQLGRRFLSANTSRLIKPAGLERVRWHKQQGHCCILISASIDVYLDPWATEVGFDHTFGTQLEVDDKGVLTGHFSTEPCWGRAKVRRLEAHFGSLDDYTVYVYGDSKGDKDLLAIADHGFLVRGNFEFVE